MVLTIRKWGKAIGVSALTGAMVILLLFSGTHAGTPTDELRGVLNRLIETYNDPSFAGPGKDKERRAALHRILGESLDEERLAKAALGKKHWTGRTQEEKAAFTALFIGLLENTYLENFDVYLAEAGSISPSSIQYTKEAVKGTRAVVDTKVSGGGSEVEIRYRLVNVKGKWLISDLAIDGIIISKNYRAQFYEMLADMSFKELMAELEAKKEGGKKR